jgi:hypothetical protein
MAITQNLGVFLTAMLPALFAWVAPLYSFNIPSKIASISFGLCVLVALAA